ncbi:hypothetical protein ACIOAU_15700 [Pseudomonas sp. NPDC088322]|uniref:hypothetical protein n=1 Tax=Pseudomonas sp. NPDC088322 TaxID=3364452 RepID=UPI003811BCC0
MSKVSRLHHALPLSPEVVAAVNALDASLIAAVDEAKKSGLPQGMIVALLHGHAHAETHKLVAQ